MSTLTEFLLTAMLNYGTPLLGGTLFLAALGLPLPATLMLLAAGAFTRQGVMAAEVALPVAVISAIAGDSCSYLLGRFGSRCLPATWQRIAASGKVFQMFSRWGGWSIFLTRFLLTPVALPVNLLAGSSGYSYAKFASAVVAGEIVWVAAYGGIGHYFASQWETIGDAAGNVAGLLLGAVLVIFAAALYLRSRRMPANKGAYPLKD